MFSRKIAKARYKEKKKLDSGNTLYVYGPRQVANRHKEKAERLDKLQDNIPKLRGQVKKDLASNPVALVIALIDETAERVGNPTSAEEGHFGVTGWRKKHLKFKNGKAVFSYVGKSGVKQEKTISKKSLVSALKKISKGKSENQELFPDVQSKDVNKYLKSYNISAKDLRGYHANDTMQCVLKRIRKEGPDLPRSRKEKDEILKKEFKKALSETAKIVGHEAATLKSQYLVPGLEKKFLHNGEVMSRMKKASTQPVPISKDKWGDQVWYMNLSKDSFIHFTFDSIADDILRSGKLRSTGPGAYGVFAISMTWGHLVPEVQTSRLRKIPERRNEPIVAIWFKTSTMPKNAFIEEVVWNRDVKLNQAKKIGMGKALSLLRSNFKGVGDQDQVTYNPRDLKQMKKATLSQTEKEDRASKGAVKPDPKKKPPRMDLRKNRSTPDENSPEKDEMLRENNKDTSRRERHMASLRLETVKLAVRKRLKKKKLKKLEEKKSQEHKPGEVWSTEDKKWRGMNPDGLAESFDEKETAEQFAKGKEDSQEEDSQEDHQAGDIWQEGDDWKGMNEDGLTETFGSEEDAREFSEGEETEESGETQEESSEEKSSEEELDSEENEGQKEKSDESDVNRVKQIVWSVIDDDDVFDDHIQEAIKDAFAGLDSSQRKELAKALDDNIKSLSGQDAHSKAMANMANKAIAFEGYERLTDPQELGKKLAEVVFAKNVIANPMVLGGKKFSDSPLSSKETSERAIKAYEHFSNLSPELKKHAAEKLDKYLKKIDKNNPTQNEANGILSAIALSSIVAGEDPVPGRPEPSKGSSQLIKQLAAQGNVEMLLKPVEDYFEPANQEVLKSAMKRLSNDELFDLVMREDEEYKEPHPYTKLRELFDQDIPIPYPWDEGIRDFVINDYLSDHIWKDTVIRDAMKNSGRDASANERYKMLSEVKREAQSALFEQWQNCLQEAQKAAASGHKPSKSTEDCLKDFEEKKKALFEAESAEQFLSSLESQGLDLPNSPSVAALKNLAMTGDSSLLSKTMKPNPEEFSGKTASRFSFDNSILLYTRRIFSQSPRFTRRQHMKKISKQDARQIVAMNEKLADFYEKYASHIGISSTIGEDMAKRLDTMSTFIEEKMGMKTAANPTDVVDPVKNETETSLQGWEMDPADIGEEDSGALLRDDDEPYMDTFNQDEYSQLREVQQGGMFSNAKAAASGYLKMAKLLAQNGIVLPVENPKKKAS